VVTLFAKPRPEPAPHADLYQVEWTDIRGHHTDADLTWDEAAEQWADHNNIVGDYGVHITAQGGAG
jgi:hypothetical protein